MLKNFAAILFVCVCGFNAIQATEVELPVVLVEQVEEQQKLVACRCKDKRFETEEENVEAQKKLVGTSELSCKEEKGDKEEVSSLLACGKCRK